MSALEAPKHFGPFLLERLIAVGGSAEVFLARPKLGHLPAPRLVVKRLHSTRGEEGFEALEREAALHRLVQHPNVVTVFGAGMVGNDPYLALEYIDGIDLFRLLRRAEADHKRLPLTLAVFIARELLAALRAVHEARNPQGKLLQIVHRDVNPSNIYLSNTGQVKLGDFGIAGALEHLSEQPATEPQGKFEYMAPEQLAKDPFDQRADLFAVGAVLGELLIGKSVFPGSGELAVLLAIRDGNIDNLRRERSHLPTGLVDACSKALAKRPADRFRTAEEFEHALSLYEHLTKPELSELLAEWVQNASDHSTLAQRLHGRVRESVRRMQAVREVNGEQAPITVSEPAPSSAHGLCQLRLFESGELQTIAFATLVERIATGELCGDDQVALFGETEFRAIQDIDELARHLLVSTTALTGRVFDTGVPDYQVSLADTSMLDVLAHLRNRAETGVLFVERPAAERVSRKEIYLRAGRLLYTASSEREELFGEYLVRFGRLAREDLTRALAEMHKFNGRLGDTLIAKGLATPVDMFRALRDQGRDRVAALCSWDRGHVAFYRNKAPNRIDFPLDLELSVPMLAGVLVRSQNDPRAMLPEATRRVSPGPEFEKARSMTDKPSLPPPLQAILRHGSTTLELGDALGAFGRMTSESGKPFGEIEVCAAFFVAKTLGWLSW